MNKKTYIVLLSLISLIVVSAVNVSAYDGNLTITDETNDIDKIDEEYNTTSNNSYPDIDLETLSFEQNGKQLDVMLKLAEGGTFKEDIFTAFYILLFTTSNVEGSDYEVYQIFYSFISELLNQTGTPIMIIAGEYDDIIPVNEYTGVGDNTLEFSFDLKDKNERLLGAFFVTTKEVGENIYSDSYPQDSEDYGDISDLFEIQIDAGGPYSIKSGQSVVLSGTVTSGEITNDYEWFWTFDDSSITLEGQNPSRTFKTPDTYTGKVYIYNGKGGCSIDTFELTITGTNTNGSSNNNEPGFELIFIIAAIAITLLIFRKKKKN